MYVMANLWMPGWLEHASSIRQFFVLSLPILVAVLLVFSASIFWERDPWIQVQAFMRADQIQLGHRRFTPARRWFSAFTLSLFEAQSVLQIHAAQPVTLDLEILDAEAALLLGLGDYAEYEEIESLRNLVAHFRREVILEAGDAEVPGLAETWVGYGNQRIRSFAWCTRVETELRIYNADDLGRQLVTRTIARGFGRWANSSRAHMNLFARRRWERPVALIALSEDEPEPRSIESALHQLEGAHLVGSRQRRLVMELLRTGRDRSVRSATTDELVDVIQNNSRGVGVRGETRSWTLGIEPSRLKRGWSSTIVVSGGPARDLPSAGPVHKTRVGA